MTPESAVWCRRCRQGWVRHYDCPRLDVELWACDECDGTWDSEDRVGVVPQYDLESFLAQQGVSRGDLVVLDQIPD